MRSTRARASVALRTASVVGDVGCVHGEGDRRAGATAGVEEDQVVALEELGGGEDVPPASGSGVWGLGQRRSGMLAGWIR